MIAASPFTTDEVSAILRCSRSSTSRRIAAIEQRLRAAVLEEPRRWARTGRADRVARAVTDFLLAAGPLAAANPRAFTAWLRSLASRQSG